MKVTCLDECRVVHEDRIRLFEETALFGDVYEVDADLGAKAIATGKCEAIVEDEEHPYTGPPPVPPRVLP